MYNSIYVYVIQYKMYSAIYNYFFNLFISINNIYYINLETCNYGNYQLKCLHV